MKNFTFLYIFLTQKAPVPTIFTFQWPDREDAHKTNSPEKDLSPSAGHTAKGAFHMPPPAKCLKEGSLPVPGSVFLWRRPCPLHP